MKTKFFPIFIATLLLCLVETANTQTISVDSMFTSDGEIYPFDTTQAIYGLHIDCDSVTLFTDTSLVRIILVDTFYNEYMVYEAYPLIVSDTFFDVSNVCDETCYLNGIYPYTLEIQLIGAEVYIDEIDTNRTYTDNADSLRLVEKQAVEQAKIDTMNNHLWDNWLWGADTTYLSQLWYSKKKEMFGYKYNLMGYDYYSGGVYHCFNSSYYPEDDPDFLHEFDWRKRHSADSAGTPYAGGSDGFMTPLKDQNNLCDVSCWLFSAFATIESGLNLYYNRSPLSSKYEKVDAILSEQYYLSCVDDAGKCHQGHPNNVYKDIKDTILVDIDCCSNYQDTLEENQAVTSCGEIEKCYVDTASFIITTQIAGNQYSYVSANLEELKVNLIRKGPSTFRIRKKYKDSFHFVALVGFTTIKPGDTIDRGNKLQPIVIDQESDWKNNTWLIYKDSGYPPKYRNIMYDPDTTSKTNGFNLPLKQLGKVNLYRLFLDLDKDGYYNWGVGNKPDTNSCFHDSIDSDDTDARIGLWDTNYIGLPVKPQIELIYEPLTYNKAIENNGIVTFDTSYTTMNFEINNNGNAQLNLLSLGGANGGPIYIYEPDSVYFTHTNPDTSFVRISGLEGDSRTFKIFFDNDSVVGKPKVKVRIALDEEDMEDFTFWLVMADCNTKENTEYVTSDTTWDEFTVKFGDVAVIDSSVLVITDTIAFSELSGLYINQGSKVILNGGVLTKACDGLWKGVDVMGHHYKSQSFEGYHGILEIENNGIIEYAEVGAETQHVIPIEHEYTGGIITGNYAIFRNNEVGVRFRPFINTRPDDSTVIVKNLSGFSYSKFYTDQYLYDLGETPSSHAALDEVEGIDFTSCDFYNEYMPAADSITLGKGIYSLDSEFEVSAACIEYDQSSGECLDYDTALFRSLDYGIYAMNARSNQAPMVEISKFDGNKTGVYLSNTPQASITLCDFDIKKLDLDGALNENFVGIYISDQCDGFQVEENHFFNSDSDPLSGNDKCIGVIINNTGTNYNILYNNAFDSLDIGTLAQERNRNLDGTNGLEIKCNDYTECEYDIIVSQSDTSASYLGIKYLQGANGQTTEDPAGNIFTEDPPHTDESNYYNPYSENIVYYYHWDTITECNIIPTEHSSTVTPTETENYLPYDPENSCPSNLDTTGGMEEMRASMNSAQYSIDTTNQVLAGLTDGGDTDGLIFDISMSYPEDALELRDQLLDDSPYLSDTVMIDAVNKEEVLQPVMITDILVANPQSAKSDKIMEEVYNRNNPLTNQQLNMINQGWFIQGAKEKLEAKLSVFYRKKYIAQNTMLRYYKNDTVNPGASYDSIAKILRDDQRIWAKYQLCMHYLNSHDTNNAQLALDSIPIEFELIGNQQTQHEYFEDYVSIIEELVDERKSVVFLDSSQIQQIFYIYNNSKDGLKAYVRNLLIAIGEMDYIEPVIIPQSGLKTSRVIMKPVNKPKDHSLFKAYPNPTNNYVIIEFSNEIADQNNRINIYRNNGKWIGSYYSQGNSWMIVDVKNLVNGIYLINLEGSTKNTSVKLVVSK